MNTWRNGNSIGKLYLLGESDLLRVGDSWMQGRLKTGDVALCTGHRGDCFNSYVLIELCVNSFRAILGSEFGAYTCGTELKWQPSVREYHLLMAGETIRNGIYEHPLFSEVEERRRSFPRPGGGRAA